MEDNLSSSIFELQKVEIKNSDGNTLDIKNLVSNFKIVESINMIFMVYEFDIMDGFGVLERLGIVGTETIEISVKWQNDVLTKKLAVVGFKEYTRSTSNNASAYSIQCISETALKARILRVNKELTGTISSIIRDLYAEIQTDVAYNPVDESTEGDHRIIVPNLTYEETFKLLISRAQNTQGSPFYFFETLWLNQVFSSWSEMLNFLPDFEYYLNHNFDENDMLESTQVKMRNMKSNLRMSQYQKFTQGGFINKVHTVDISNKTYSSTSYSILNENLPKLDREYGINSSHTIGNTPINDIDEAYSTMVYKNSLAFEDSKENLNDRLDQSVAQRRFVYENQDFISHSFEVNGNSLISAGFKNEIKIPVSTDPSEVSSKFDVMMSGEYITSEVIHTFNMDRQYNCKMVVKKDSTNRESSIKNLRSRG